MQQEEKIIKEIIKKFGDVINLRETPHIIIEIIRKHGGVVLDDRDGGLPPAGAPNPPPPGPDGFSKVRFDDMMKEILKLSKQVHLLTEEIKSIKK